MKEPRRTVDSPDHVPFQARIASVALITTVAVLLAACASFMLQQWAVSREEARLAESSLNAVVAEIAAPALAAHDVPMAERAVSAAAAAPSVISATLVDERGRVVAHHENTQGAREGGVEETVRTAILFDGGPVGALVTSVRPPSMMALLPQLSGSAA